MTQSHTEEKIFSISELNQTARTLLETGFGTIWVEGEISNFVCPRSGHWYFSLKDENAQVRCAMFRGSNKRVNFTPDNGAHIAARVKVSLYPDRGDFQLIVEKMEEVGSGALQRAFEALKKKLDKEGLFDPQHKKEIPQWPTCIGVITSPTGAAIRDILSVLKRRFPSIPVLIYPSQVQGEHAAGQLVQAIELATEQKRCDTLILSRGGGSLEDLWPFNEEILARAIFDCPLPIISGVGHEIDMTIADFVADLRAPTPSAAAELASPDQHKWQQIFQHIQQQLHQHINAQLQHQKQHLHHLKKRLRHPRQVLNEYAQRFDHIEKTLCQVIKTTLGNKQHLFEKQLNTLQTVNPLNTLSRGYALATRDVDGKPLENTCDINIGDRIGVQLHHGHLTCDVIDKK